VGKFSSTHHKKDLDNPSVTLLPVFGYEKGPLFEEVSPPRAFEKNFRNNQ